jgi:hypothetical protein
VTKANAFACVGRGYPDLSVVGHDYLMVQDNATFTVSSTSASAPVVAGMISLVNSARLTAGKSSLGWLNPALYANYQKFTNDVTSGDNNCVSGGDICCGSGYNSIAGWDPVTGLGSVNFTLFREVLTGLGEKYAYPTAAPTPGIGEPSIAPALAPTAKPSFAPTVTTPTQAPGWFTVNSHSGQYCLKDVFQLTAMRTNDCLVVYNQQGVAIGSQRYTCGADSESIFFFFSI